MSLLYKYSSAGHLNSFLSKATFAFPLVHQLNDPYESSIESALDFLRDDYKQTPFETREPGRMIRIGGVDIDHVNPSFDPDRVRSDNERNRRIEIHNRRLHQLETRLTKFRDRVGVLSLTDDPLNVVMWAHYGDLSTGCCIGLDAQSPMFTDAGVSDSWAEHPDMFRLKPVDYQADRPAFSEKPTAEYLSSAFFTKHTSWSCEREFRLLRPLDDCVILANGVPIKEFPRDAIREVLLGANVSDTNFAIALQLASQLPNCEVYMCRVSNADYAMTRHRFNAT